MVKVNLQQTSIKLFETQKRDFRKMKTTVKRVNLLLTQKSYQIRIKLNKITMLFEGMIKFQHSVKHNVSESFLRGLN